MKKTTSPYLLVCKSRIHGAGVFAKKDIPKGVRIIEYVGERITKKESDRRADIPLERNKKNSEKGAVYIFEVNKRHDLDGHVSYNTARYINHSCEPNCESENIRGHIWIISLRDIKKGEEISYNYGYQWDMNYVDHKCCCGMKRCVGYILAEEHWKKLAKKREKAAKARKRKRKS